MTQFTSLSVFEVLPRHEFYGDLATNVSRAIWQMGKRGATSGTVLLQCTDAMLARLVKDLNKSGRQVLFIKSPGGGHRRVDLAWRKE